MSEYEPKFYAEASAYKGFLIDLDDLIWDIQQMPKEQVDYDYIMIYLQAIRTRSEAARLGKE